MKLLEINDIHLRLSDAGRVLYDEPGAALVEPKKLTLGQSGLNAVKLYPAKVHTQFWHRIDQTQVEPKGFAVSSQIDLVYQQLKSIKETSRLADDEPIWFAVPGDLTDRQLALLYGSAQKARIGIADFIDYGVLVASTIRTNGRLTFINVGLQRTIITRLQLDDRVQRTAVSVDPQMGLLPIMNTWIRYCAELFLDSARFDPRKFAETEHQIFSQLLEFVRSDDEHRTLKAEYRGAQHQVEVAKPALIESAKERFGSTLSYLNSKDPVVLLEDRLSIPGLTESLREDGYEVHLSQLSLLNESLESIASHSKSEGAARAFHVNVPRHSKFINNEVEAGQTNSAVQPTHLLHQAEAQFIGDQLTVSDPNANNTVWFELNHTTTGLTLVPVTGTTVSINGKVVKAPVGVFAGDSISTAHTDYQLIVVKGHATG